MPRASKKNTSTKKPASLRKAGQLSLLEPQAQTAPCVSAIRKAMDAWRAAGYKGATETTRLLLNYWFKTDHRLPNGRPFVYHDSQKFAIETLIYLYEVAGVRRHKGLVEQFAAPLSSPRVRGDRGRNRIRGEAGGYDLRLLQYDDFARYCIKMATGSGKTKVMSLAIAWQYFNAVAEARDDYARTFLLFAPNVIVFERLRLDFANGKIFRADPIIPPELKIYWDFDCYMRGDAERASSQWALYLTNIQQFYERSTAKDDDEPDIMTAVLGPRPPAQNLEVEDFDKRIVARGGAVMVINDEAHHTHDEDSEWNKVIRRLHENLSNGLPSPACGRGAGGEGRGEAGDCTERSRSSDGLAAQLDFSATPRYSKGALFTWTIFDYPLKQAIIDGIVKRPLKGIARNIQEGKSPIASTRYKAYLTAGVERWREYFEQLKPLEKKPILFVMLNDTNDADDVGDYLQKKYPSEFGGKSLLIIHTDKTGEVSKKDLDKARKIAREADDPQSPVNAIVSVLMLREGWDVHNVTVVVGLRPYSSKANILPEQTIGRGLRLMFRGFATDYIERVDVIGNKAFIEFVEDLEREEEIAFDTFEVGKDKLSIVTIQPDPEKLDKDIAIPVLSPILARKKTLAEEIAALDVLSFACSPLPRKEGDSAAKTFQYDGYDLLTLQKLVERSYTLPEVQTSQEVISYYAKRIAQDVKLPSQFAALHPKVHEFLEQRAFGAPVNLDDPAIIKAISTNVAQYVTVQVFVKALRPLVVQELEPQLISEGRKLSETPPFPYSRPTLPAAKTVFNLAACGNEFEKAFAKFLENAPDIQAFAKLPEQFGFAIEYTDSNNNLRYYEPDFVAITIDGSHYLVETKGREDVDVANKDRAAILWCENATRLTGKPWQFIKVPQKEYEKLQADEFLDLLVFSSSRSILYPSAHQTLDPKETKPMKFLDLTIPLGIATPAWPTYEPLQVKYFKRLAPNGANGQVVTHSNHLGTHLDGEIHFHTPGKDIASLDMDFLVHEAAVVDLSDICGDYDIYTSQMIEARVEVREGDILIIHTGYHHFGWDMPTADEVRYMVKHPGPDREFAVWAKEKKLRWIGVDCGSADHPMNTIIRDWMPRQARQAEKVFQKKHGMALAEFFDDSKYQLMHLEMFPHGIIHAECLGGELDLILNRRVTIGMFPWRFVDGESCIARCVAMVDDAEYEDLQAKKAALPKTRFGDAYEPKHVESVNQLSKTNME